MTKYFSSLGIMRKSTETVSWGVNGADRSIKSFLFPI